MIHRAVLTATRPMAGQPVREIYAFEVPSSTEWAFGSLQPAFRPNVFVDVSATLDTKIAAMGCYQTEMREFPHPRSTETLRAAAMRWGSVREPARKASISCWTRSAFRDGDHTHSGPSHRERFSVYVIAEVSANHHQSFEVAEKIIRAAKQAGADAVKLQTYTPDTITIQSDQSCFKVGGGTLWDGCTLYDLYAEAHTPWEWQPRLKKLAESLGMDLFSSPFDSTAVDFLEAMGVPAYKVASFELVDIPLIQRMARTGKPLIMSTGMGTLEEIEEALQAIRSRFRAIRAVFKLAAERCGMDARFTIFTPRHTRRGNGSRDSRSWQRV